MDFIFPRNCIAMWWNSPASDNTGDLSGGAGHCGVNSACGWRLPTSPYPRSVMTRTCRRREARLLILIWTAPDSGNGTLRAQRPKRWPHVGKGVSLRIESGASISRGRTIGNAVPDSHAVRTHSPQMARFGASGCCSRQLEWYGRTFYGVVQSSCLAVAGCRPESHSARGEPRKYHPND